MSENKTILTTRRFELWWRKAQAWFATQFASINVDLTPVEEKVDEVKSDVADVKTAVENQQLSPTAELDGSAVLFHYVTLEQMEKMHINTNAGIVGFDVTEDDEDFHLRFSQDSPQELAGEIVYEDSLAIKDDVFETIRVPLVGYEITYVRMDGVDANLLEADINWRLADLQKRIGEGGEDPNSKAVAEFFGLPQALPEIEVATEQEVKGINDDVMGALYGYGKVTVTIHSLMRTGAETTQDLASVIYVDPEKTWAENGFPTLYDEEGTAIDATTNPSEGDEVYLYQITQNS